MKTNQNAMSQKRGKKGFLALCLVLCFACLPSPFVCARESVKIVKPKRIRQELLIGHQLRIQTNLEWKKLTFHTDALKVACVSKNGIVTARREGKAVITVRTKEKEPSEASIEVIVKKNKEYDLPVKSRKNSGLSNSIPYVLNKKGNKAKYDKTLTKKLGELMRSYSSGCMNNMDKDSQQYIITREHFIFLNEVSEKWVRGVYSKKKAMRLASNTKFYMWDPSEEPYLSLKEGTIEKYEVRSRDVEKISNYIGKTNFSAFQYVYTKCFYDKKTGITTVYLVNGLVD